MNYDEMALELHARNRGKLGVHSKVELNSIDDMSTAYSPGVAAVCREIAHDPSKVYDLTFKGNAVAVVSDGSAVLGLGNIGAAGAMPVMEGKALLFKELADIDAIPICIDAHEADEIIAITRAIAPTFGGINLEDIAAPKCFVVEEALQDLPIPVFHDDQHGTAVVVLAAMVNALRVVDKEFADVKVVFSGAGASGIACCKILQVMGVENIIMVDSRGIIHQGRDDLNAAKQEVALTTNPDGVVGDVHNALDGADVFIGLSTSNLLDADDIRRMSEQPIVLPMANPDPEIFPDEAFRGGAAVVGTGRSDLPNQVNNVLAFPGILRGALDARADRITTRMKVAAGFAISDLIPEPTPDEIIPYALNTNVVPAVAKAVGDAWQDELSERNG